MCIGGSSAKTDRSQTLSAYDRLNQAGDLFRNAGIRLTGTGTGDTGQAADWYSKVLRGDPSAFTPEAAGIQRGLQQQQKQASQFGNRTGGTNEAGQTAQTTARGQLADIKAGAQKDAAQGLTRIGATETGQGLGAIGGAGDVAANLGNLSVKSRELSQKIHDNAVQDWADVAAAVLLG